MIYFNNAATSYPKPDEVNEALMDFLNNPPGKSARSSANPETIDVVSECRQNLAKLFNYNSDPKGIILNSGSTESLNLAIRGLDLKGAHVITTAIEHNSVLRPLKHLERDGIIELTIIDCDPDTYIDPQKFREEIRSNTRAIIVNHTSNVTGVILDIKTIAEIAHSANALIIVDASQAAGNIPIDFDGSNLDLMAFTGHKSLYGLQGTGGLAIHPGVKLTPLKYGGTGVMSNQLYQPDLLPYYYEAGTANMAGITALNAGVKYVLRKGIDNIRAKKSAHVKRMIDELGKLSRIKIYTKGEHNSLVNFCFNIDGMAPEEIGYALDSIYGITVRTGIHCAPLLLKVINAAPFGTVRSSPSYFTADNETDLFIAAVREITETFL